MPARGPTLAVRGLPRGRPPTGPALRSESLRAGAGLHLTSLPLALLVLNSGPCPWSLRSPWEPRLEVATMTALAGVRGMCEILEEV